MSTIFASNRRTIEVRDPFPAILYEAMLAFLKNTVDSEFQHLGLSKTWHLEESAVHI